MAPSPIVWGYVDIYRRKKYVGGASRGPQGRGRALQPRVPLVVPLTYFFLLYIPTYPENIQEHHETLFHRRNLLYPRDPILGPFSKLRRRGH